jgi:hypothetical protein
MSVFVVFLMGGFIGGIAVWMWDRVGQYEDSLLDRRESGEHYDKGWTDGYDIGKLSVEAEESDRLREAYERGYADGKADGAKPVKKLQKKVAKKISTKEN